MGATGLGGSRRSRPVATRPPVPSLAPLPPCPCLPAPRSVIKEAFYLARTGRPGPVLVDVPKDIQQQLAVPDWEAPMSITGEGEGEGEEGGGRGARCGSASATATHETPRGAASVREHWRGWGVAWCVRSRWGVSGGAHERRRGVCCGAEVKGTSLFAARRRLFETTGDKTYRTLGWGTG